MGFFRYKCRHHIASTGLATGATVGSSTITAALGSFTSNTATLQITNTLAYVSNLSSGAVTICTVDSDAGTLSDCATTGCDTDILTANSVALNPLGTMAYVADLNSNAAFLCSINASTGLFDSCDDSGAGAVFANTLHVLLNADGSKAYVHDDGAVLLCDVSASTGALSNCVDSGFTGVSGLWIFSLNTANTRMYLPRSFFSINTIYVCDVNATTGALSNCADAATDGDETVSFSGSVGVVLN